ncbi:MAG: type II secretion system protein [Candidatus Aminicenantes bacterium]|jgi:prepilin-type N-terminal cleavage/methylation domain-containing protein
MRQRTKANTGFTLIEIMIVIVLTSILIVAIFQALGRVRTNESKLDEQREGEREVYLVYLRLANLFKNISSFKVFNNREQAFYFHGHGNGITFLSRSPLLSPYGGIHFIDLYFREGNLLYREKMFREPEEGDFISFEELEGQHFYPLLEGVDRVRFQYYLYDEGMADFTWKEVVNSFEKDSLPLKISFDILYNGKAYHFIFHKVITDENKEIPPHLLK